MTTPKAERLNEMLDKRFGLRLDFASGDGHLSQVLEHYCGKRRELLHDLGEAAALQSPQYAKAVMISETVRLYLREIAPKRLRKKNRKEVK